MTVYCPESREYTRKIKAEAYREHVRHFLFEQFVSECEIDENGNMYMPNLAPQEEYAFFHRLKRFSKDGFHVICTYPNIKWHLETDPLAEKAALKASNPNRYYIRNSGAWTTFENYKAARA